jgi:peptidoglycan/LPS O-acetylase OafA/YrhL
MVDASKGNRIPELDGLRAIAVLFVVIYHIMHFAATLPEGPPSVARLVQTLGFAGVSVFFVISGYIITSLLLREKLVSGRVSLSGFYLRRAFRILPPFALYICVIIALRFWDVVAVSPRSVFWSVLFLQNGHFGEANSWLVSHTWSLSVEEQYYVIFPSFFCLLLGFRRKLATYLLIVVYVVAIFSFKLARELESLGEAWSAFVSCLYSFRFIIVGVLFAFHARSVENLVRGKSPILLFGLIGCILCGAFKDTSRVAFVLFSSLDPIICGMMVAYCVYNPSKVNLLRTPSVGGEVLIQHLSMAAVIQCTA